MTKAQEMFANMGLMMASVAMQELLSELFANIKKNNTNNPTLYTDMLKGLHGGLNQLNYLAQKTKTSLDDNLIAVFFNPVKMAVQAEEATPTV